MFQIVNIYMTCLKQYFVEIMYQVDIVLKEIFVIIYTLHKYKIMHKNKVQLYVKNFKN